MEQAKHIDMQTPNGAHLNLNALYKIAPSCFTEAKGEDGEVHRVVDFNKLRLLLGDQTVEDAQKAADCLGIVLTENPSSNLKLAGFPHHALDSYLPKLVRHGYRVAICEALESPKKSSKRSKKQTIQEDLFTTA